MENIKKVLLNALKVFTLFLVICVFYYATNVLHLFSAFSFGFLTVGGIFILFFYMLYKKKLDKKEYNFFSYKDDNFVILSKTSCNQLECDYNSNGICVRVGLRGDNKGKIGICWQDWGKGEY